MSSLSSTKVLYSNDYNKHGPNEPPKEKDIEDAQDALEGLVSVLSLELDARKLARDILQGFVATG